MADSSNHAPIIGLEIHVELKTNSKMFCGCKNDPFSAPKPNIYTCPVCLGLPGALPIPNKKAIEWTIMVGLALGCSINKDSKFDRKHYFYPDLPKGYQISQYDQPFAIDGELQVTSNKQQAKTIRIRRVHLEEDTAKMLHQTIKGEKVSLIDFNRSGVPLVEIVTEPDIRSPQEAKVFAKKIHQMVRFLGISDADMEKGSMRLEANISLFQGQIPNSKFQIPNKELPTYKVELKNINSFRFLERAIESEVVRQQKLLENGETIAQETRGWDSVSQTTTPQRVKEEAADYRYFPEPDIPPIRLTDREISNLKSQIPKMPDEIYQKLIERGFSPQMATLISSEGLYTKTYLSLEHYDDTSLEGFFKWLQHRKDVVNREVDPEDLMSRYKEQFLAIQSDEVILGNWVEQVIREQTKAVSDYKAGKEQALQSLIGQVQKLAKGKANVVLATKILRQSLNN